MHSKEKIVTRKKTKKLRRNIIGSAVMKDINCSEF